jgi:hypothetical protein
MARRNSKPTHFAWSDGKRPRALIRQCLFGPNPNSPTSAKRRRLVLLKLDNLRIGYRQTRWTTIFGTASQSAPDLPVRNLCSSLTECVASPDVQSRVAFLPRRRDPLSLSSRQALIATVAFRRCALRRFLCSSRTGRAPHYQINLLSEHKYALGSGTPGLGV